nr:glycosyltransferase family 39 protein [Parvularcula dongshanensis]
MDDAKTNLFTQVWQWGYQADNPPLFEWLIKLLHPLAGGGIYSFLVLKYAALAAAAGFLYLAARRFASREVSFGAAMGMVLLYQVGWNYHQAFTHSALLLTAVCGGMWSGLVLARRGRASDFAVFGAALGVGLMTKYNYILFAVPFLVAGLTLPEARGRLLKPAVLLVPLAAMPFLLPHALWLLERGTAYSATLEGSLGLAGTRLERLGEGAEQLVIACVSFFLPWALIAVPFWRRGHAEATFESRILVRTSLIAIGLIGLGVAFGVGSVSERYVIPALLPAYLAWTVRLLKAPRRLSPYLTASAGFTVLVLAIRLAEFAFPGPPFCEDCRRFTPYEALEAKLAEATPSGSVYLSREENTAGNLVAAFPDAKVRSLNLLPFINPTDELSRPCYYVWSEDTVGGVPLEDVFAFAYDDPHTIYVDAPWRHPLKPDGWRRTRWGVTPLTGRLYTQFCTPGRP